MRWTDALRAVQTMRSKTVCQRNLFYRNFIDPAYFASVLSST